MYAAISIREARSNDVGAIVDMLADDPLGKSREKPRRPLEDSYYTAFDAIDRDPNQHLVVATIDGRVVGVLQLTLLPYLTYRGGWRALIEGVRVDKTYRSRGIGRVLFGWAIEKARARDCHMVQLTTDKSRPAALRFYESLGFAASHEGMKLHLDLADFDAAGES